MKKTLTLFLAVAMIAMMCVTSFASQLELVGDVDTSYYEKFKDDGISINVYNWGEYISDGEDGALDINKAFEELTGIKVYYTNFATNEELYAKLRSGGVSYDVIIPSEYMVERMINEDMLEELNLDNIPNIVNLDPALMGASYDSTNSYSLPYTWGSVVIIYNSEIVDEDEDVNTWDLLWNEKYKGQILMFNNPRDAVGIASIRNGKSLNPSSADEITEAFVSLAEQKPLVQSYVMDEIFDKMGAGEAAIAPYYAGDALTMMDENPALRAVTPREGTNIFVDAMCIPKGAEQQEAAEMYINFMLEATVGAANAEYIGYSTPNLAAMELLDEEITGNPMSYPDEATMDTFEYFTALSDELNKELDAQWTTLHTTDDEFAFWIAPALLLILVLVSVAVIMNRRAKKRRMNY